MVAVANAPAVAVIAIDGLVLDTITLRARALQASLALEGVVVALPQLMDAIPGHALGEVIDACAPAIDAVAREVVALRAQQTISRAMASGVALHAGDAAWMTSMVARGVRVIGRADATRNDIDRVLPLLSFGDAFVFVRCADDQPRVRGAGMLESAYHAVAARVAQRWPGAAITAYELTADAASTAAHFVHAVVRTSAAPA